MSHTNAPVKIEGSEFDLEQITMWAIAHPWVCAIAIAVALVFWILRPNGFGGSVLEHRASMTEMQLKAETDRQALIFRYGPDGISGSDPLPPARPTLRLASPDRRKRDRRQS
jgi:hypothetical protein